MAAARSGDAVGDDHVRRARAFRFHAPLAGLRTIVEARPPPPLAGTRTWVLARDARTKDVVLMVTDGTALRGRVLDAHGRGRVVHVTLIHRALPGTGGVGLRSEHRVVTGPDGHYALIENVRPGDGPFALRPTKGGRVRGSVEGRRESGVVYNAAVTRGPISIGTLVGADGTFAIDGVPPGPWHVAVYANGVEQAALADVEPDGEPLTLRLDP